MRAALPSAKDRLSAAPQSRTDEPQRAPLTTSRPPKTPAAADVYEGGLDWPPYASNITFELWGPTNSAVVGERAHHVRVLYNHEAVELPCSKGPGRHCSLSDFRRMIAPYLPVDFAAECHLEGDGDDEGAGQSQAAKDMSVSSGGDEDDAGGGGGQEPKKK